MSREHARGPATRCSLPALVTDVARSKKAVRHAFDDGLGIFAGAVSDKMEDPQTSLALIAAAVGALLSLAFSDDEGARRPRFDRRADPLGARKEGFMSTTQSHVGCRILVEAEEFEDFGGWTLDSQFGLRAPMLVADGSTRTRRKSRWEER